MKNLGQMMKQAQEMQAKMQVKQEKLADIEISGSSGGDLVLVSLNGKCELLRLKIDPSLFNAQESEVIEDLIVAAFADGKKKLEGILSEEMSKFTGGLNLPPGMNFPI